ncbi:MAG: alginate export family protein [Flavobacteriales bacterium]|jgi:hypothetical protein|nr:alginate export family protein [Flavobacteriales bacterium]
MKTGIKKIAISLLMIFGSSSLFAQFTMDAQLRPRTEVRTGSKDALSVKNQKEVINTSQRTRLNLNYKASDYSVKVSLQDVRNWGSASTLSNGTDNNFDIHEAWVEIMLTDNFSMKGGRQELVYDDHRIMGNVGWAQQARSHDLGIIEYNGLFNAHLGLAYNSNNEVVGSYEKMNYLWISKDLNTIKTSILGLEKDKLITFGGRLSTTVKDIALNLNYYSQNNGGDLNGTLLGLAGNYNLTTNLNIGLGYEQISGADSENLAFSPVFGTNHKFNGHMDYFYVGNHANSVGLNDMYFSLGYSLKKAKLNAVYHLFSADTEMDNNLDGNLGNEIDMSLSYAFNEDIKFSFGHSIYNATESMINLKGGEIEGVNNWTYFIISVNPKLIK